MKVRTVARQAALQYLYQVDITSEHSGECLNAFIGHFVDEDEAIPYTRELIDGVYKYLYRIDERIDRASDNWSVRRMSRTDRNILRIAVYEMIFRKDIPYRVAINEGIELAKRFGSPKFPGFLNGIMDHLKKEVP